jgi:hypothetical protein
MSALIDFSTTILLCVIVLGIIRACQLCLGFDWLAGHHHRLPGLKRELLEFDLSAAFVAVGAACLQG